VAVVAHSGGLGFALFNDGLSRGLGFSHVISTGNEVDLDLGELAGHLVDDPATRVLLLFLEGIDDPGRLTALGAAAVARQADRGGQGGQLRRRAPGRAGAHRARRR
jgi:acyl-CoA synthetase (NDP forming)